MASASQIANDLRHWAGMLRGTGQDTLCRSLARGASTILDLQDKLTAIEAATEVSATVKECDRGGDNAHG